MKKFLAIILATMTVLNIFAGSVFAEDTVEVLVTISDSSGILAVSQESINVTDFDNDEKFTIRDALYAVHEEKFSGGAQAGYADSEGSYGLQIDKLWGVANGGSYSYYLNDAIAYGILTEITDGDYLNAFIYTDLTGYSDKYSFFDKRTTTVKVGEEITLTLKYSGYDADYNPITVAVEGADITANGSKIEVKTDSDGKATFKFTDEGEYTVSAVSDTLTLVSPVCKVTVDNEVESDSEGVGDSSSSEGNSSSGGNSGGSSNVGKEAKVIIDEILKYHYEQENVNSVQKWIDGALSEGAGITSEWYILGLSQYKNYNFDKYEEALIEYLDQKDVNSASTRLKYALMFATIGSTNSYIKKAINNSIGEQGIMSYVFGLHLLNNGYKSSEYSSAEVINELLDLQLADGGFSISESTGDVDTTAMTLQALAPHRNKTEVKKAINYAVDFLASKQRDSGEYASYGIENPESTAQVIIALASVGIDCKYDNRFIKGDKDLIDILEGYQLSDGSFSHIKGDESSEVATSQVFYAMVAQYRLERGKDSLFILDNCEIDYGLSHGTSNKKEEIVIEVKDGWVKLKNGKWQYLENKQAISGWKKVNDIWYYFDENAIMKNGWEKIDNTWYYLKSSGAMATGWVFSDNTWYYLKSSGAMATGWIFSDNTWYYLKSSGAMATGWVEINGKWYYLYADGKMATNTSIGKYKVDASGAWIK